MTLSTVVICTLVSLFLGLIIALTYMFKNTYSKNFIVTLVLLPAIVQSVIMVVNGNLGTGVAVMGAFSLVRFRSAPGSAKEIVSIFLSMAAGLANGMGYVTYSLLITAFLCIVMIILSGVHFGENHGKVRTLRITIPEDLNYIGLFDDLFKTYTSAARLEKSKTTNLGSLFELQYVVHLKDEKTEKEFIDEIRKRNGNLSITCGLPISNNTEL